MQPTMTVSVPARRTTWVLVTVQVVVAAAYFYGVVAYLTTDAAYFPEQAPPAWAVPAVLATLFGPLVALLCLLAAVPLVLRRGYRAGNPGSRVLVAATVAGTVTLLTMASPLGWAIFDWYVS
jgi:hypothetical protein